MNRFDWTDCKNGFDEPATRVVYDGSGHALTVNSDDEIGGGAEGVVYSVPGCTNVLAKLWKLSVMNDASKISEVRARLKQMLELSQMKAMRSVAWPQAAVFGDPRATEIIGFVMKTCSGVPLSTLFGGAQNIRNKFPRWTRMELASVARQIVQAVMNMEQLGVHPCDFNPANILVRDERGTPAVSFIDADSMQFLSSTGRMFSSHAYFPAYASPELLTSGMVNHPRTNSQTEFACAMLVFSTLMAGYHPYQFSEARDGSIMGDPSENLKRGICALGKDAAARIPAQYYPLWSNLTYGLKNLFVRWFRDGHSNCAARPSLHELAQELDKLIFVMSKDSTRCELMPARAKSHDWIRHSKPFEPRGSQYIQVGQAFRPRGGYVPHPSYGGPQQSHAPYQKKCGRPAYAGPRGGYGAGRGGFVQHPDFKSYGHVGHDAYGRSPYEAINTLY